MATSSQEFSMAAWSLLLYQRQDFLNNHRARVGHQSEIKSQGPCENEYKKYCLNGAECYYLVDEDFVGWY